MDDASAILQRLKFNPEADVSDLITSYQLRPTLLDSILPESLALLTSHYRNCGSCEPLHTVYIFARVRGSKLVLQNLPTDIDLLSVLSRGLSDSDPADWRSQFALLLWLAAVVLVPFDLNAIEPNLEEALYSQASQFICRSGIQRDAATILMARLLTRGNPASTNELVSRFFEDFSTSSYGYGDANSFASIAVLQVLAQVMDRVPEVPDLIERLVDEAIEHAENEGSSSQLWYYKSTLTSRLWLKVLGRAALRRIDEWGEFAVAECIDLFDNKSSQVRMAAAKYVARVAQRMDAEAAAEICDTIVSALEADTDIQLASVDFWNGALIALAEILRRAAPGDLAPELVERLVLNVLETRGLHFVQATLRNSVGSSARDAACYTCWSLFRSKLGLSADLRQALYSSLISLACLDSEVNIRRAAAAALQEGLGRYGSTAGDMPATQLFHTMERINLHTVSSLTTCYLDLAPEFCTMDRFFVQKYITHGVDNTNADVRRIAGAAASNFPLQFRSNLIDAIVADNDISGINLHGKLLALGALYASTGEHEDKWLSRLDESRQLLHSAIDIRKEKGAFTDLEAEGIMSLALIQPALVAHLLEIIESEDERVISRVQELMKQLSLEFINENILPQIKKRLGEFRLSVASLVTIFAREPSNEDVKGLVLQASRVRDPQSRALAVQCLNVIDEASRSRLLESLKDYSEDKRGDVGAWVREAAIYRLVDVGLPKIESSSLEFQKALWLMASESRQKIRHISGKALFSLGLIHEELNTEVSSLYYLSLLQQCPHEMRMTVAIGIASSVGAARASAATINGSIRGLIQYLESDTENQDERRWIIEEIIKIDRKTTTRAAEVVRTLRRLITDGYDFGRLENAVLAVAYNTTLNTRYAEQILLDAIDILQVIAFSPKTNGEQARNRLVTLVKRHPNGRLRQRAADALFEIGIEDEALETIDWTRRDALKHSALLKI